MDRKDHSVEKSLHEEHHGDMNLVKSAPRDDFFVVPLRSLKLIHKRFASSHTFNESPQRVWEGAYQVMEDRRCQYLHSIAMYALVLPINDGTDARTESADIGDTSRD